MNKKTKLISLFGMLVLLSLIYSSKNIVARFGKGDFKKSEALRSETATVARSRNQNLPEPVGTVKLAPSSNILTIGTRNWYLDMGDIEVDTKQKASIYQDINRIMRFKSNPQVTPLLVKFELQDGRNLDRRVTFMDGAGIYPSSFRSEYIFTLFQGGKDDHLYINTGLVADYERVVKMELDHQDALVSLDGFLDRMENILENPIRNLSNLFIVPEGQGSYAGIWVNKKPKEFAKAWGGLE